MVWVKPNFKSQPAFKIQKKIAKSEPEAALLYLTASLYADLQVHFLSCLAFYNNI